MNEFDLKAAGWDQNPIVWDRAEAIANEIKRLIPLNKQMTALEIWCRYRSYQFYPERFFKRDHFNG